MNTYQSTTTCLQTLPIEAVRALLASKRLNGNWSLFFWTYTTLKTRVTSTFIDIFFPSRAFNQPDWSQTNQSCKLNEWPRFSSELEQQAREMKLKFGNYIFRSTCSHFPWTLEWRIFLWRFKEAKQIWSSNFQIITSKVACFRWYPAWQELIAQILGHK